MSEGDLIVQNTGWFAAGLAAIWAVILRWLVGRHIKQFDALSERLTTIDTRLSIIEGRFDERDHYRSGRETWPGDSR
jgi:hypothetical protein